MVWLCAGSATMESMHRLVFQKASELIEQGLIIAAAVQSIQDCARHDRQAASLELNDALTMTMLAVTETKTFQVAQHLHPVCGPDLRIS